MVKQYRASDAPDLLRKHAQAALQRPSNYMNFDSEVQYGTHGAVLDWADRGGDLLAESNFHVMLGQLQGVDPDDDVLDRSSSHWAVGSLRTIFVRVYLEGWDVEKVDRVAQRAPKDVVRLYTPAFRLACDLVESLMDYPILDESDYGEREHQAWTETVEDAVDSARREFSDTDSVQEEDMFFILMTVGERYIGNRIEHVDLYDRYSRGDCSADCVDYGAVEAEYRMIRDAHFEFLAARHWAAELAHKHRNQLSMW